MNLLCNDSVLVSLSLTSHLYVRRHKHVRTHTHTSLIIQQQQQSGVNLPKRIFCSIIFSLLTYCRTAAAATSPSVSFSFCLSRLYYTFFSISSLSLSLSLHPTVMLPLLPLLLSSPSCLPQYSRPYRLKQASGHFYLPLRFHNPSPELTGSSEYTKEMTADSLTCILLREQHYKTLIYFCFVFTAQSTIYFHYLIAN